jgi:hypothetical protein
VNYHSKAILVLGIRCIAKGNPVYPIEIFITLKRIVFLGYAMVKSETFLIH